MRPQYLTVPAGQSAIVPLDVNNDGFLATVRATGGVVEVTLDNVYLMGVNPLWTPAPAEVAGVINIHRVCFAIRITAGATPVNAVVLMAEQLRRRNRNLTPSPSYATPTLRQTSPQMKSGTAATGTITMGAVTAGSYLMVLLGSYISTIDTVVGSVNGAYTKVLDVINGGDNRMSVWVRPNAIAAPATSTPTTEIITVTPGTPGNAYATGVGVEWAGIGVPDKTSYTVSSFSSTNLQDNATPNALVITGTVNNVGGQEVWATPVGYTLLDRDPDGDNSTAHQFAYKVVSAVEKSSAAGAGAGPAIHAENTYDTFVLSFTAAPSATLAEQVSALYARTAGTKALYEFGTESARFQDSAGTTPTTAAGQPIGLVLDQSGGTAVNLAQPTAASRPLLQYDGSGFPFAQLDGADDSWQSLIPLDLSASNKLTVIAGVRKRSDTNRGLIAELSPSSGNAGTFVLGAPNTAGATGFGYSASATASQGVATTAYPAPVSAVLTGITDATAPYTALRVNGTLVGSTASSLGTGNMISATLNVGRRNNTNLALSGDLYVLMIFATVLTADEIALCERYVASKMAGVVLP